jgi:ribulose-5-phosphate 4-epimerase/fuculose-1-phosphate aldolase
MTYAGIKFKPKRKIITGIKHPKIKYLRLWCNLFYLLRLAPPYIGGSYGNLSFRVTPGKNEFIITCANTGLGKYLCCEDFALVLGCDFENWNVPYAGLRNPSSESPLHAYIYLTRPDVMAIFHGHSNLILSLAGKMSIAKTDTYEDPGTIELVSSVKLKLKNNSLLILKDHGFLTMGTSMLKTGILSLSLLIKCLIYKPRANRR